MPDAVIVAAARTPIGRAAKGSLVDARPDDLAAFAVRSALAKVPGLPHGEIVDVMVGCGFPQEKQGMNLGAARRAARRAAGHGSRHDGEPLLRVVAADDPDGPPRDPRRRGRRVRRGRRRVDHPGERVPEVGGRDPPGAVRRQRADRERLHPDGAHGRERRRALGRLARGHGPVRAAVAGARGCGAAVGLLRARDHAVRRRVGRRRAARLVDAREAVGARAGVQARRQGDGGELVPAERRRGRGGRHVARRARRSSGSSRARGSSRRRSPASSRRSWASARSRRCARCSRTPA